MKTYLVQYTIVRVINIEAENRNDALIMAQNEILTDLESTDPDLLAHSARVRVLRTGSGE
jgi:hypothetical protein